MGADQNGVGTDDLRICVSNIYYFANNGDAALMLVLFAELRRVFGNPDMTALTMEQVESGRRMDGVDIEPGLSSLAYHKFDNRIAKAVYTVAVMALTVAATVVWRITKVLPLRGELRRATRRILEADLMVLVGGGYFRGKKDAATHLGLLMMLHPLWIARLAGVPVAGHSQSIGPFGNRFQKWFTAKTLDGVEYLAAREDVSMNVLTDLGLRPPQIGRAADAGFLFETTERPDLHQLADLPGDARVVGVTVRQWLDAAAQQRYERAVADVCEHIIDTTDAYVVFIPQVTVAELDDDDRVAGHRVAELIPSTDHVRVMDGMYSPYVVKALYESLDVLIGTRFHSVIFALTAQVPAIAIEYEHKTSGIMAELGLSQWVTGIGTVSGEELIGKFEALTERREQYRKLLVEALPPYQEKARRAADEIGRHYRAVRTNTAATGAR